MTCDSTLHVASPAELTIFRLENKGAVCTATANAVTPINFKINMKTNSTDKANFGLLQPIRKERKENYTKLEVPWDPKPGFHGAF